MADNRLQVFYTVAKQLSFTKAAEQLFMTQPAVMFQVKQLEEHFNARLFERSHGKIALSLVYPREKFRSRLLSTFVEFAIHKMREIASRQ